MDEERNPREYFEYNEKFTEEIKKIEKEKDNKKAESIAQSLFEIIEETLKTIAANPAEKKSILDGFAEAIRDNAEKKTETIEAQSIVFNKLAEKLQEYIKDEVIPENWQKYKEKLEAIVAATKPQELAQDVIFLSEPEMEKLPIELGESFLDVDSPIFSAADRAIDPITRAIRTQILTKQRELIVTALVKNAIVKQEELNDINKFRTYFENEQNKETISELLKTDKNLKQALEQVEIIGYKNVHTEFASRFTTMEWQDGTAENASGITTRKQVVRDANNNEIATLAEATHKINPPHIVQKSDGTNVAIHNYRTIDFPIKLDNNGPMHLSLAVKDQNGRNIAASNAVYFTAHYDDDGKLIEVSSPHPVKFSGNSPDAVGYIEHGGQIYTLPVMQQKYKAMMQEVAKNLGQGVNISPSIEAPDLTITSRQKIEGTQPHRVQKNMVPIDIVEQENMVPLDIVKREEVVLKVDIPVYSKDHQITREERIESVSGQKTKETQPYKMQENMEHTMVNREAVILNVNIPEYTPTYASISEKVIEKKTVEQVHDTPKISQAVSINSDARDKTESIRASLLKSQHIIRPPVQKIEKLVGELSESLEGKEFEKQKKDIDERLKNLSTPQEQIKLLEKLAETIADKRGKTLEQVNPGKKEHNIASVRLITENKTEGKDGEIVKPQQIIEHVNVSGNVKLQMFLQNKIKEIKEVSKKPIIVPKTRNAGSFHGM